MSMVEDRWEVVCRGGMQRGDVIALIDAIFEGVQGRPEVGKCLVDIRATEVDLGIMGEFMVGEYAAKRLGKLRMALIQVPGQVNKLLEDAAYNRGLRISMVGGRSEALEWLNR